MNVSVMQTVAPLSKLKLQALVVGYFVKALNLAVGTDNLIPFVPVLDFVCRL
jgi:hypothetical protein